MLLMYAAIKSIPTDLYEAAKLDGEAGIQMANIAQTINVLQAVILTEGSKIILTLTYHAFNMYKIHQDAELIDLDVETPNYTYGDDKIPQVSATASMDKNGKIHVGDWYFIFELSLIKLITLI